MHPEEAELAELADQLARQDPLLEPVADVGQDLLAHEGAHGVADRPLLVVEEASIARKSSGSSAVCFSVTAIGRKGTVAACSRRSSRR